MCRATGARSCDEDKRANDQALVDGCRLLSAYRTLKNERLWVITEAADDEGQSRGDHNFETFRVLSRLFTLKRAGT